MPKQRPVLAVVNYLNTRPLIPGLDARCELVPAVPARCWELVAEGRADLGVIPALGLGDDPDLIMVPDVAIAAEGPVRSVVLVTRMPLARLRTVAVDVSSRASAVLLRILCARSWQIAPRFVPAPPDWEAMLAAHDAALLIGDPAFGLEDDPRFQARADLTVIDLGAAWTEWTGLPFVFAVWAGRADRVTPEIVRELQAARDRGLASLPAIARTTARTPAEEDKNLRYLRDTIRYRLGPRERAGLARYLELAGELGLLAGGRRGAAMLRIAGEADAALAPGTAGAP
jgi:chorismate dehydratase